MSEADRTITTPAPVRLEPDTSWEHYTVWARVREVIRTLPRYFRSSITVTGGVSALEVFTFGGAFSSVIEAEVLRTLNETRMVWDPDEQYAEYEFVRQAEQFPDVLLVSENKKPVFGIELKSWYLLAKEEEPSPRFRVSAKAIATADLFVVVPWALSNVVTGSPVVYEPFVELAKYVAEYRNYWWQHLRKTKTNVEIKSPPRVKPYPSAREQINDVPAADPGGNFGRIARTGIMNEWVQSFDQLQLLGIPVQYWRRFFKNPSLVGNPSSSVASRGGKPFPR